VEIRPDFGTGFFQKVSQYFEVIEVPGISPTYKIRESVEERGPYEDVAGVSGVKVQGARLVRLAETDRYFEILIWDYEEQGRGPDWVYGLYVSSTEANDDATGVWLAEGQAPPRGSHPPHHDREA
jgi:hypothetical protein